MRASPISRRPYPQERPKPTEKIHARMGRTHPWEPRLGVAPFEFLRIERMPKGSGVQCDDCGHTLQRLFWVRDARGANFKVGCECIEKVELPGSTLLVAAKQAIKEAVKTERDDRIAAAQALLAANPTLLADELSPWRRYDGEEGKQTVREMVEFLFKNAGMTRKIRACEIVEGAAL